MGTAAASGPAIETHPPLCLSPRPSPPTALHQLEAADILGVDPLRVPAGMAACTAPRRDVAVVWLGAAGDQRGAEGAAPTQL